MSFLRLQSRMVEEAPGLKQRYVTIVPRGYSPGKDGWPHLTPDANTAGEVIADAETMIRDLRSIIAQARRLAWTSKRRATRSKR